jgi:hypothetical protein
MNVKFLTQSTGYRREEREEEEEEEEGGQDRVVTVGGNDCTAMTWIVE